MVRKPCQTLTKEIVSIILSYNIANKFIDEISETLGLYIITISRVFMKYPNASDFVISSEKYKKKSTF